MNKKVKEVAGNVSRENLATTEALSPRLDVLDKHPGRRREKCRVFNMTDGGTCLFHGLCRLCVFTPQSGHGWRDTCFPSSPRLSLMPSVLQEAAVTFVLRCGCPRGAEPSFLSGTPLGCLVVLKRTDS